MKSLLITPHHRAPDRTQARRKKILGTVSIQRLGLTAFESVRDEPKFCCWGQVSQSSFEVIYTDLQIEPL